MAVRKRPFLPQLTDRAAYDAVSAAYDQIDRLWRTVDEERVGSEDFAGLVDRQSIVEQAVEELKSQLADLLASSAASPTTIASGTAQPRDPPTSSPPTGTAHPNYQAAVQQARDDLVAAAVDLSGPCGAFEIIRLVTFRLSSTDPAIGILDKPTGNNCNGFAVDIIVFTDGYAVDALIGSGVDNTPTWNVISPVDPSRWRSPIPGSIP